MKYIIYKIQIKDYIYIGSTQNFTIRKAAHKKNCNNENEQRHNCLVYRTIRDNGGWDCCSMVPIKEIEVESKRHAEMVEEATRVEYNAQMNTRRAYQTEEELKEYQRQYNRTDSCKETRRQYYENRKEIIKEYNRLRYLARKAKLADSPEIKV